MTAEPIIAINDFEIFAEVLDHPEGLAFDSDHNLWAGGELGQLYRIDGDGAVDQVATLGGFALGLTFSRQQNIWVCNPKLGALQEVDRSGRLLRTIDVGRAHKPGVRSTWQWRLVCRQPGAMAYLPHSYRSRRSAADQTMKTDSILALWAHQV